MRCGSDTGRLLTAIVEGGILFLLVASPLAFGSVEDWAELPLQGFTWLLAGALLVRQARSGAFRRLGRASPALYKLYVAFCVLVLLQLIPLPGWISSLLSSSPASLSPPPPSWRPISLAPAATQRAWFQVLAFGAFFLLVMKVKPGAEDALGFFARLVVILTILGFLLSVFGIVQKYSWTGKIYWFRPVSSPLAQPFGPYVNRNHFAGYLEMVIPLSLSLFISLRLRGASRVRRPGIKPFPLLLGFMILIMALALFLTLSRAGMLSFFIAMLFFAFCCHRFHLLGKRAILISLIFLALFFLLSFTYFGWEPLLSRLQPAPGPLPHRLRVWHDALRIIGDYPVLGTGLGTFGSVYPAYKSFSIRYAYPFAENDYLQLAVETGIIGLLLGMAVILAFFLPLFRLDLSGIRRKLPGPRETRRLHLSRRALLAGGYSAVVGLLAHSLVDFNLHIPANAVLLATVAALSWRTLGDLEAVRETAPAPEPPGGKGVPAGLASD